MASTFDILVGGSAASDFSTKLTELEVEENLDLPGAFRLTLPITVKDGDLDVVSDPRLGPLSNIAVTAQAADGQTHCLIDGYVLSQEIHIDTGAAKSAIKVSGQDATWLMNVTETAKEWADVTDGSVANTIFQSYGFQLDPGNLDDDSPARTSDGATLMQRASDAQFLRGLARRDGKLFRVFCTDTPGQRTGYFGMPSLDGDPVTTLVLNPADSANVGELDISWDVMRPSAVVAMQALLTDSDPDGAGGTTDDDGLSPLDKQALSDFAAGPVTAILTTPASDAETLTERAQSMLREAGWFVRCEGATDAARLGSILRAGTVAQVNAAGALHSGPYLVWSVRHHITAEKHEMKFVLVRNAVGAPAAGGGGLLGGLGL
jgi:hypothetical protein